MPRLCKSCGTYPRQLVADKSKPSVKISEFIYVYPTLELDYCYMCSKIKNGMFDLPAEFFRRGNLVNSHNDRNYPQKGGYDGLH